MAGRRQILQSLGSEFSHALEGLESSQDDDVELVAAITARVQASAHKAKKTLERKFVAAFEGGANKVLVEPEAKVTNAIAEMDSKYKAFTLAYASLQDDIRKIWVQLLEDEDVAMGIFSSHMAHLKESGREIEAKQIQYLSLSRKSCEDYKVLIDGITSSQS